MTLQSRSINYCRTVLYFNQGPVRHKRTIASNEHPIRYHKASEQTQPAQGFNSAAQSPSLEPSIPPRPQAPSPPTSTNNARPTYASVLKTPPKPQPQSESRPPPYLLLGRHRHAHQKHRQL